MKRILADDFVWVREGNVLDKSRAVTGAQQGPGDFVSNHLDYANVRFFGDTAVVQGSETWTRKGDRPVASVRNREGQCSARSDEPMIISLVRTARRDLRRLTAKLRTLPDALPRAA